MSKKLFCLVSFVLVLAVTGTASAGQLTITIDNPGFEDPVLAEDDWTWLDTPGWIPGWTWVGGEGPGIWNVTSADFDPVVAPEGQNVLYTENAVGDAGGVAQVLTETFAANTDYTPAALLLPRIMTRCGRTTTRGLLRPLSTPMIRPMQPLWDSPWRFAYSIWPSIRIALPQVSLSESSLTT